MNREDSTPVKIFNGKNPCCVKAARIVSFASSDVSKTSPFGLKKAVLKDEILPQNVQLDKINIKTIEKEKDKISSKEILLDNKISKTIDIYKFKSPFTKL